MRRQTLIPFLLLALAAACGKDEAPPPTAQAPAAPAAPAGTQPAPGQPAQAPAAAPAAPAATAPDTAPAAGQQAQAPAAGAAPGAGAGKVGEDVYKQTCAACHAAGVAGAPKLGDKADWQPRIAQGKDLLYEHSIKGFTGKKGVMPPKGGNLSLNDEQVKAAVDYMVAQAK